MVAAGAFEEDAWRRLQHRLERNSAGRAGDPIKGVGYPRLFSELQNAHWFSPFDPASPKQPSAADPAAMAGVLLGLAPEAAAAFAATGRLEIERVRYVP